MSRSSARRAQVEPVAALVAVFAVCTGLALYAAAVQGVLPGERSVSAAEPALTGVEEQLTTFGVAEPDQLPATTAAAPDGYAMNVTLSAGEDRWTVGPSPVGETETARQRTAVRTAPGIAREGRLRVEVWT